MQLTSITRVLPEMEHTQELVEMPVFDASWQPGTAGTR